MRRPSDLKLPDDDIRGVLMRLLRGYAQDLKLNHRDQNTRVEEVTIDEDESNFILNVPSAPDFEAAKLEFESFDGEFVRRFEARLVPLDTWSTHYNQSQVVASIYGGNHVAINLSPETVAARRWFLTYRPSLLTLIQMNSNLPLPSDFIPMIETEGAILSAPLVRDDSAEWVSWMERTMPVYGALKQEWNNPNDPMRPGRWQQHLASSNEPQIQTIRRSDRHGGSCAAVKPFIPAQ